jgi:hypothetical protein
VEVSVASENDNDDCQSVYSNTSIYAIVIGNCQWAKRCLGPDDASSVEAFVPCTMHVG